MASANKLAQPFLNIGGQPEVVQKTRSQIQVGNAASHSVGERSDGEIKIHPVYVDSVSNRMENTCHRLNLELNQLIFPLM